MFETVIEPGSYLVRLMIKDRGDAVRREDMMTPDCAVSIIHTIRHQTLHSTTRNNKTVSDAAPITKEISPYHENQTPHGVSGVSVYWP